MYRNVWLETFLKEAARTLVSVGIALIIFLQFFHKPIVVVSLAELERHIRNEVSKMSQEEAIKEVALFWALVGDKIAQRKDIVVIKEAVLNSEKIPNITQELIQKRGKTNDSK